MFSGRAVSSKQFPIVEKTRKSTDVVCTVVGALFAVAIFTIACCLWDKCTVHLTPESFDNRMGNREEKLACRASFIFYEDPNDLSVRFH